MRFIYRLSWVKRHKWISITLLFVILALIVIFRPKPLPEIPTEIVKRGKIVELLTASGSIRAKKSANLSFLAGGKLTYVGVQKGSVVKRGQTIATVDQRSAQKNLEASLLDYSIQRNAFEGKKEDYGGRSAKDALNDAMKRILEDNQYNLEKAVNSVELIDLSKQNLTLTSPMDGIITRADITASGVNATAATTYTVVDNNSLVFEIDVDETDIAKVKVGYEAQIILEAYPDDRIFTIITSKDFASHTTETGGNAYTVQASLPKGTKFDYLLGMNGDADIILSEKSNTLILPIVSLEDEKYVYVKRKSSYEKRLVRIGLISDTEVEVLSGVKEDEQVALQPEQAAKRVKSQ